ncbi:DUF2637 domain-containing protein [Brevibacterium casei]|uniref:DUF2637 domain-containing protein n=1 Tax=Brevibacterium ammoniilyticum TaxID=1046555 RepID=A0ABP9U343_9MICO|nr:DUF2637 domain-containing protein [Brevibacterium casei]QQT68752.1 DUF2637 domain-containing protein [Brevibacterium casei]
MTPDRGMRGRVSWPVVVAVAGTLGLAGAAFVLSFTALRDLAALAGIPAAQSWLWPLVVDGVILEATISVVALRNATARARRFAWLLLVSGAGISVAANITHAVVIVLGDERIPALIAAFVASVPPLTLVAMTHLTVELIRNTGPTPPDPPPLPVPGAEAIAEPDEPEDAEESVAPEMRLETQSHPSAIEASESSAAGEAGRSRQQQRALAVALAADPSQELSFRQIAERVGVHPTTVGRWVSPPIGHPDHGRNDDEPDT